MTPIPWFDIRSSVASKAPFHELVFDPKTGRPSLLPIGGATPGLRHLHGFRDPAGKSPDQLLVATSEGVMRLQGDSLVPAMPAVHGLTERTYFIDAIDKDTHSVCSSAIRMVSVQCDGMAEMDRRRRMPKTIYEVRSLVEDADGAVWAGGTK